jgi:hypothetical protein
MDAFCLPFFFLGLPHLNGSGASSSAAYFSLPFFSRTFLLRFKKESKIICVCFKKAKKQGERARCEMLHFWLFKSEPL